jgi:hypothetical protein
LNSFPGIKKEISLVLYYSQKQKEEELKLYTIVQNTKLKKEEKKKEDL